MAKVYELPVQGRKKKGSLEISHEWVKLSFLEYFRIYFIQRIAREKSGRIPDRVLENFLDLISCIELPDPSLAF